MKTKIDFSGITSDRIVTSDNKKYIHEDDEIFNSLKDEIAACENAQVQTELATLEILEIKEQTREIANEVIDNVTERAETAAQNAETAQSLSEIAAINALEAERNVTEFSETLAKLNEDNTFSGTNNFTGSLTVSGNTVLTTSDASNYFKLNTTNTINGNVLIEDTRAFSNFGYDWESKSGAILALCSKDYTDAGFFKLYAQDGTNRVSLIGNPNGELKWGNITIAPYSVFVNDSVGYFSVGYNETNDDNPRIAFFSKDNATETNRGAFALTANDGTNKYQLVGKASDGGLFWGGKRVVTHYGNQSLYFDHTAGTSKDVGYSTANNNTKRGAYMTFWTGEDANNEGRFRIVARNETKHIQLVGTPAGDLTWNNSAIPTVASNNTFTGTNNFTGTLSVSGNNVLTTSDASNYFKLNTSNTISGNVFVKDTVKYLNFGYEYSARTGALLALNSINHDTESSRGSFSLFARDATNSYVLTGRAYDGALTWKGNHVITQKTPYNINFDHTSGTNKVVGYGQNSDKTESGSYVKFYNKDDASSGYLQLVARNLENQASLTLNPSGSLKWSGKSMTIDNKSVVRDMGTNQATSYWFTHLSSTLLIQSGQVVFSTADTTSSIITLSTPYDSAYYTVLIVLDGYKQSGGAGMMSVVDKTTTGFKIHNGQDIAGTYRWVAIGFSTSGF